MAWQVYIPGGIGGTAPECLTATFEEALPILEELGYETDVPRPAGAFGSSSADEDASGIEPARFIWRQALTAEGAKAGFIECSAPRKDVSLENRCVDKVTLNSQGAAEALARCLREIAAKAWICEVS